MKQLQAKVFNQIIGVQETHEAPRRILEFLSDKQEREGIFRALLEAVNHDLSYDWLVDVYTESLANKKQGQVLAPPSLAALLASLVDDDEVSSSVYEPCAGTGTLAIAAWHRYKQSKNPYVPRDFLISAEEVSPSAIPFLLLNLMIRGINACVLHMDSLTREAYKAFVLTNFENDPASFSILSLVDHNEELARIYNLEWVGEAPKPCSEIHSMEALRDNWNA